MYSNETALRLMISLKKSMDELDALEYLFGTALKCYLAAIKSSEEHAVEVEPGLVADLKSFFNHVLPENGMYNHNLTHPDSNGHSHIRASLIGPSITIPVVGSKMKLGVWQQIIFIDFDNIPRDRELVVQMVGE